MKVAIWFVSNAALAALVWFGLIEGHVLAANVAVFFVWMHNVCGVMAFLCACCDHYADHKPSVSINLNVAVDFAIAGLIAASGRPVLAAFFVFASVGMALFYKGAKST